MQFIQPHNVFPLFVIYKQKVYKLYMIYNLYIINNLQL